MSDVLHIYAWTEGPDEHDTANGPDCWCGPQVTVIPASARNGPAHCVVDHGDLPHPGNRRIEAGEAVVERCPWCAEPFSVFGLPSHMRAKHAIRGVA